MKKKPSFIEAVIPILSMVLLLGIGYGVYGLRAEILMLISAGIAGIIAARLGYTWEDMMNSIVGKLSKTMPAILILIIVGVLIGSWMIGGTIPMMVYYGLKIINPKFIVITSFYCNNFFLCYFICFYMYWNFLGFCRNNRSCSNGSCFWNGNSFTNSCRSNSFRSIFW